MTRKQLIDYYHRVIEQYDDFDKVIDDVNELFQNPYYSHDQFLYVADINTVDEYIDTIENRALTLELQRQLDEEEEEEYCSYDYYGELADRGLKEKDFYRER